MNCLQKNQGFSSSFKFGLSEEHTKFEKNFLMVLKNQLIYLVNVKTKREIFFKLCVLVRKSKLYLPRVVQGGVLEVLQ